jgi:GT2 family glycosyltransferase
VNTSTPFLSVIMPVYQGTKVLPLSLSALAASDMQRDQWELVLVDDASTDGTPEVAAPYADTIVRLAGKPRGPAYARNRGFEAARGEIVVFIDADVCVHVGTLSKFAKIFRSQPDVAAVFGSYDASPTGAGLVSQFRNLMHHYVHHRNAGEAETFWAGCGAVRSAVFAEVGMFDEWHYSRPQIEDIELGRRLRQHGCKIQLDPAIQGTHLKRWTLWNMLTTDMHHRGVPWMWLLLKEGPSGGSETLNVRKVEKLCTAMVGLAGVAFLAAVVFQSVWPLLLGTIALLSVITLNRRFYIYLQRQRGFGFAVSSIFLHLLCYGVNTVSVISGWLMHALFGEPVPPDEVSAHAEVGSVTWPPNPARPTRSIWDIPPADAEMSEADHIPHRLSGTDPVRGT